MYIVKIQNGKKSTTIHGSGERLTSGKIVKGINTIDSFQFSMLPSNRGFSQIHDYTTLVSVYNTNRKRYEFYGRVLYSEDEMGEDGSVSKEVICESYLGFLCDSQQDYMQEKNWTVGALLQWIINKHNEILAGEDHKQFYMGKVTVTDPNDNVYCGIQRENTWETIQHKLIEVLGGEISFRILAGKIYLDYLAESGEKSETEIKLSKNLKSITRERDPSEIVTRLIPLGCKRTVIGTDEEGKETEEESEYRIDIADVNNGKRYIDDENAIALYGIRVGTVIWDDVTVKSTLLVKGENWLKANNKLRTSYTLSALDLSLIGLDEDDFELGKIYPVSNSLLDISEDLRIIKKTIDICEPVKNTLEFGDTLETLSASLKKHSDSLNLITANYVTNERFKNEINKTSTLIEQTSETIKLEVRAEYEDLYTEYNSLNARVASIELSHDEIASTVATIQGDEWFGTKITQNSESVQIAWNGISNYVQFTDDEIKFIDSSQLDSMNLTTDGIRWKTRSSVDEDQQIGFEISHSGVGWVSDDGQTAEFFEGGQFLVGESSGELSFGYTTPVSWGTKVTLDVIYLPSGGVTKERGLHFTNGLPLFANEASFGGDVDLNGNDILNQSDVRLKRNIEPTDIRALDLLSKIEVKSFDWIESGNHVEAGMIAQQLQEVSSAFVAESEKGKLSIRTTQFIPYLIKAVQELAEITTGAKTKTRWIDTYTEEEKTAFAAKIKNKGVPYERKKAIESDS